MAFDNLKLTSTDQVIITRLSEVQNKEFIYYKSDDKFYRDFFHSFKHKDFGVKFCLHFRKVCIKKVIVGYASVDIVISPHYNFNNYLHNGNDLTPDECAKSIIEILTYLKIQPPEYEDLKVVNMEFGLNIIPETDITNLVNGIFYTKKASFLVVNFPYFRISKTTVQKLIKAYAKGLQFIDYPEYGINVNTFRFELKSKKSAKIKTYGIYNVSDLLKIEIYQRLAQELLNEWDSVLILNLEPDFSQLKNEEVEFIKTANKKDFWEDLKLNKHRNTFHQNKVKYGKLLNGKNNLHAQIKGLLIDKIISLSKCA